MCKVAFSGALVCALALTMALSGCGGGSGSSAGGTGAGRVVGNVFGSSTTGSKAPGPITVTVEDADVSTTAGSDGRFVLDGVPAGLHTLVAQDAGQALAIVVSVEAGGETAVGDLILKDAGQISGLVTSSADGSPIADAVVTVAEVVTSNTATTQPYPIRTARTNASGSYTISGLPAGPYLVSVSKDGFDATSLAVNVTAGTTTPGDVQLTPAAAGSSGSMTGTVSLLQSDGTRQPLAGVLVRMVAPTATGIMEPLPASAGVAGGGSIGFYGPPAPGREFYAFTGADGTYTIDGVPPGSYMAGAVRPGFTEDRQPVTVEAGAAATVNFTLQVRKPSTGIIEGVVTDASTGKPIASALVGLRLVLPPTPMLGSGGSAGIGTIAPPTLYIVPGDVDAVVKTDVTGAFSMRAPAGTIGYFVQANGYYLFEGTADVTAGATTTVSPALTPVATTSVTLSGTVTTIAADGVLHPVAGAEVVADQVDMTMGPVPRPIAHYTATTAVDGTYRIEVAPFQYDVSAHKELLYAPPQRVNVTADTTVDLTMSPWPLPVPLAK